MERKRFIKLMLLGSSIPGLVFSVLSATARNASAAVAKATRIANMPVYAQQHYLSCEFAASRAATALWGFQFSEADFIKGIPANENPHLGFRGDIDGDWGWIYDYGIYPEPIARFLNTKGLNTKLIWNNVESIKEELSYGRPVIVWVISSMDTSTPITITPPGGGDSFVLAPAEHAMTLYGYDEDGVLAANPGFGTYEYYSWESFGRSWAVLGNMGLSIWPVVAGYLKDELPGIDPAFYAYWLANAGLEIIGRPLGLSFRSNGRLVQYYEKARLEWDDNKPPVSANINRGLLGRELTLNRLNEPPFLPLRVSDLAGVSSENQRNFSPQTGFYIDPEFVSFWQTRGGLAAFGFPISRSFSENGLQVQYFERVKLELHPGKVGQNPSVLVGLLGSQKFAQL